MNEIGDVKQSRWWIAYHLWGGFCFKLFFDVSGFSEQISRPFFGSDEAGASLYASVSALVTVASIGAGYLISKSLVTSIANAGFPNKLKIVIKVLLPILYFVVLAVGAAFTAEVVKSKEPRNIDSNPTLSQSTQTPVLAFTTIQDSEGVVEKDMNQAWLAGIESWIVDTTREKARSKFVSMGYSEDKFNLQLSASSVYTIVEGKKLAVVKLDVENATRTVTIMGINQRELIRVTCIRKSDFDIPVWSGVCGDEIKKSLGVSM